MKEEDLSRIKRYPIVEYLERKGIKPVRSTPAYALYRSPFREDAHPSFKVDTEKNLWIDYGEGKGGSIIDLCMRLEGCTLSETIRHLGRNTLDDTVHSPYKESVQDTFMSVNITFVTLFTLTSVDWADKIVAINSSNGVVKLSIE